MIEKSAELDIDLNAKNANGETAFNLACYKGESAIIEVLIQRSAELNIDLNVRDLQDGWTGFHWACYKGIRFYRKV